MAGAYHAGDRRQVCVDRVQIMIAQLLKVWPGHQRESYVPEEEWSQFLQSFSTPKESSQRLQSVHIYVD